MTAEDGKAPASHPLARWALATAVADVVLLVGLARLPRPTLLDAEPPSAVRGRVVRAYAVDERAVFVRTEGLSSATATVVVVARNARTTAQQVPYDILARLHVAPCRTLAELGVVPRDRCAPREDSAPDEPSRDALSWYALEGDRWAPKRCAIVRESGASLVGERSVTARCDGVELGSLRGFRVENPWVSIDGRRVWVDRDVRVERAILVRDRARRALFVATADGTRIDLDPGQPKRGIVATLAGKLGADGLAAAASAWFIAQVLAVAAARSREGSSAFWRRFLRWSAMLSVFVTGALALAALRASQ
ncbi:MAG: hypothetical protein JNK05_03655 [Myxococcales bacterium]|nr:hypothetical protein [Myxococcales bacterium]